MGTSKDLIEESKINTVRKLLYREYSEKGHFTTKSVTIDVCKIPRLYGINPEEFILSLSLLKEQKEIDLASLTNPSTECLYIIGRVIARLDKALHDGIINRARHNSLVSILYNIAGEIPRLNIPSTPSNPVDEARVKALLLSYLNQACDKIVAAARIIETMGVSGKALLEGLSRELIHILEKIPDPLRELQAQEGLTYLVDLLKTVEAVAKGRLDTEFADSASKCLSIGEDEYV